MPKLKKGRIVKRDTTTSLTGLLKALIAVIVFGFVVWGVVELIQFIV